MASEQDLTATLLEILKKFQMGTPGVIGSGVISADGFTIAADMPTTIEDQRVAAMTAAILALGNQMDGEFDQGGLERISVEGKRKHVIVASAGPDAMLSAVVRKDATLGLVYLQMQRAVKQIRGEIE